MASGPSAALSHQAAARLWGLLPDHGSSIDVTTPRSLRRRAGIRLHRLSAVDRPDLRGRDHIPLTSPALTVLDLAASAGPETTQAALDEARFHRLLAPGDFERLRRRHPRRAGWAALGSLLDAEREPGFSRSEAERLLLRLIRDAGLPEPHRNHRVHGYELDLFWPEYGLAVEIDGYRSHGRRGNFERDRARDADLGAHGISVRRFTWHQITRRGLWLVARLAAAVNRG
jgi:very-short-patch-repair endonuclease